MDHVLLVFQDVHLHDFVGFFVVPEDVADVFKGFDLLADLVGVD